MPFVEMDHGIVDSEVLEHFRSAYAKNNFLAQPLFHVPGIEAGADGTIPWIVGIDVGVEQIQRNPADIYPPYGNMNGRLDERHPDHQLPSISIQHPVDGGLFALQPKLDTLLPAIGADVLFDVTFRVHESQCHQGNVEVAAFLEEITGQKPQTPSIERQRMVKAVFGAKISDGGLVCRADILQQRTAGLGHVFSELGKDEVVVAKKTWIPDHLLKAGDRKLPEHFVRIMNAFLPPSPVNAFIEISGGRMPAPPKILRQFFQSGKTLGKVEETLSIGAHLCHLFQLAVPWPRRPNLRSFEELQGHRIGFSFSETKVALREKSRMIREIQPFCYFTLEI